MAEITNNTQDNSDSQMTSPPWAWIKAVNNILSNPPFEDPDTMPVQLLPWLYISDEYHSIRQIGVLQKLQITHVLSTNLRPGEWQRTIQGRLAKCDIAHKAIAAKDEENYNLIAKHWEHEAKPFLIKAKNHPNGKVVVHCTAGTNRSGLIAAAAMLLLDDDDETGTDDGRGVDGQELKETINNPRYLLDIVKDLKQKRHMVLTNLSFQQQLCTLAGRHGRLGEKPSGYSDEPARLQRQRQAGNFESMFL